MSGERGSGMEVRVRAGLRAIADGDAPVVADVARVRRDARRHRQVRAAAALVAVAAVTVVALVAPGLRGPGGDGPAPPATQGPTLVVGDPAPVLQSLPDETVALAIGDGPVAANSTLARTDRSASTSAWGLVVRASDGSFGRHGAVVVYPVETPRGATAAAATPVPLAPDLTGQTILGGFVWPVGRQWASIRGDLRADVLKQIALSVRIVDGRPQASPPPGHRVVVTTRTTSPLTSQVRYGSQEVGGLHLGDGPTDTGVALGAAIEDAVYEERAWDAGRITDLRISAPVLGSPGASDVPALATNLLGGNGSLVWEVSPGVVTWIGWSGAGRSAQTDADVVALAARARLLDSAAWAATSPQEVPAT